MIIDTHVHFDDEQYKDSLEEVIDFSTNNDVTCYCNMGIDYESSVCAIKTARELNGKVINNKKIECFAFVGLFPESILKNETSNNVNQLRWIDDLIVNNKDVVKGIGEIGIDLYWDKTYKDEQIEFFKAQLDKAVIYNLPVSIHAREATQITYDILKEYKGKLTGVLHCYSGSVEMAKEFVKLGFKLGIGGTLTYKNSKLWEVIEALDIRSFVTETDGPYLSPVPYRGKRNMPGYLTEVVSRIAEIKQKDIKEIEEALENNAREVFNL